MEKPSFEKCIELEAMQKIGNMHWLKLTEMVYSNKVPDSELKPFLRIHKTLNRSMVKLMSKYAVEFPATEYE